MENKLSSGRSLLARLGGRTGILQNVAAGSNSTFLSARSLQVGYLMPELQGCSPLAS